MLFSSSSSSLIDSIVFDIVKILGLSLPINPKMCDVTRISHDRSIGSKLGRRSVYYNVEQDLLRGNFIDCRCSFSFLFFLVGFFSSSYLYGDSQSTAQALFAEQRDQCRVALCAIIPLRMKKRPSIMPLDVAFGLPLETSEQWNLDGVDNTGSINEILRMNVCDQTKHLIR